MSARHKIDHLAERMGGRLDALSARLEHGMQALRDVTLGAVAQERQWVWLH
ncbi:hypothetical protein HF673_04175 [Acidithiobacillus thiooxidans]|uniref:hypothetical protein n=1 Tax=Acidithiobacillus TaxID=119977 RepID=UPI00031377C1|nr:MULTISPECIES: hypothetical protein [Acidithiobacillus]MBU2741348.1 hypothetical protein [Acidithiobacillus albertensis]MBU2835001.1 hypothetical protein [Acidithiobacillus thiooxidans]